MSVVPVENGGNGAVEVTFKGRIAIVTMLRGENRFNDTFIEKLNAAFDEVLRNPDVHAMITTSTGKFYSNGLDLAWMANLAVHDPQRLDRFRKLKLLKLFTRLISFPIPTVALVNGHAFAAGAMLTMCHDHVIMQNHKGWWCMNEIHIKLRFMDSMLELFRSKMPTGPVHHEAIVLGRRYTGDEASAAGVVHESCPPKELYLRAQAWISKVVPSGGFDRQHLQTMKEDVYHSTINAFNSNEAAKL